MLPSSIVEWSSDHSCPHVCFSLFPLLGAVCRFFAFGEPRATISVAFCGQNQHLWLAVLIPDYIDGLPNVQLLMVVFCHTY